MVHQAEIDEVIRNTYDPDVDIDLMTLGLIYKAELDEAKQELDLVMTFTTPLCPYGGQMVEELKQKFLDLGLSEDKIHINVTFNPPWQPPAGIREMLGV